MIIATILKAIGMSSSVRRDYPVAGSQFVLMTRDDRISIDAMSVLEWLRHITGLYIHEVRQVGDEKAWEQILRELRLTSSSFIRSMKS
jgi:hypothetical protein